VAGDGLSAWRVVCPACGAEYLLPAPWAGPGARVRCPGCGAAFRAADPRRVRALRETVLAWAAAEPGGLESVQGARAAGFFWRAHGPSLCATLERGAPDTDAAIDPAALESALAQVLGPGPPLL
jgi:hypothetical protein